MEKQEIYKINNMILLKGFNKIESLLDTHLSDKYSRGNEFKAIKAMFLKNEIRNLHQKINILKNEKDSLILQNLSNDDEDNENSNVFYDDIGLHILDFPFLEGAIDVLKENKNEIKHIKKEIYQMVNNISHLAFLQKERGAPYAENNTVKFLNYYNTEEICNNLEKCMIDNMDCFVANDNEYEKYQSPIEHDSLLYLRMLKNISNIRELEEYVKQENIDTEELCKKIFNFKEKIKKEINSHFLLLDKMIVNVMKKTNNVLNDEDKVIEFNKERFLNHKKIKNHFYKINNYIEFLVEPVIQKNKHIAKKVSDALMNINTLGTLEFDENKGCVLYKKEYLENNKIKEEIILGFINYEDSNNNEIKFFECINDNFKEELSVVLDYRDDFKIMEIKAEKNDMFDIISIMKKFIEKKNTKMRQSLWVKGQDNNDIYDETLSEIKKYFLNKKIEKIETNKNDLYINKKIKI